MTQSEEPVRKAGVAGLQGYGIISHWNHPGIVCGLEQNIIKLASQIWLPICNTLTLHTQKNLWNLQCGSGFKKIPREL